MAAIELPLPFAMFPLAVRVCVFPFTCCCLDMLLDTVTVVVVGRVVVVVIVVEVEISSCCILRDYSLLRNYNCFDFDFDPEFDNKQYSNIEYNIEYFIP